MSIVLDAVIRIAINPALAMFPVKFDTEAARVMLLAITLQEADAIKRVQSGDGPAHGLWQFEIGGVRAVMTHHATKDFALGLSVARKVFFNDRNVWEQLIRDDILAAGFARLLLYSHPKPLPDVDDTTEAWEYYEWLWRPGKPRPDDWVENHKAARSQILS